MARRGAQERQDARTGRIMVQLDPQTLRAAESRLRKAQGGKLADAVRSMLREVVRWDRPRKRDRRSVHRELVSESASLVAAARELAARGRHRESRRLFLLAAVREVEGLIALVDPDEDDIVSALIGIVGAIKDGTGYRSLPDVPRPPRRCASA